MEDKEVSIEYNPDSYSYNGMPYIINSKDGTQGCFKYLKDAVDVYKNRGGDMNKKIELTIRISLNDFIKLGLLEKIEP